MKINYVPGLSLRFFPGLSRNPDDAASDYIATGSKIVILTGDAPTESALWDLTDLEAFLALNEDKIVYRETTDLKYSYDGFQLKRIIQRLPIDSTKMIPLCNPQVQTIQGENPGEIVTANNLYALIYSPDKDNTLNTQGNDLIMLIPDVGTNPDSYLSISKTNFTQGETMYFRNLTISLFQGYQITDAPITEMQDDPENPGSEIPVVVGSKKNVFYNKIWANRIAEAFRDCFISEQLNVTKTVKLYNSVTKLTDNTISAKVDISNFYPVFSFPSKLFIDSSSGSYFSIVIPSIAANLFIRKVDPQTGQWLNADASNIINSSHFQYGYLVNQAVLDLLDEINQRSLNGTLPSYDDLFSGLYTATAYATPNESKYFRVGSWVERDKIVGTKGPIVSLLSTWLLNLSYKNVEINASFSKLLIGVMGFEESLVQRAIKSIIPFDMDITAFVSTFDKESNVLTVQNMKPMKLDTRYKKSIFNPTNEGLFLLLNRNRISGYNICELYSQATPVNHPFISTLDTISFPLTQTVLDGEPTDINSNRVRIKDYTAISIGLTSNGETDLEYDILDNIDYIDSFTVMVKVPNKF